MKEQYVLLQPTNILQTLKIMLSKPLHPRTKEEPLLGKFIENPSCLHCFSQKNIVFLKLHCEKHGRCDRILWKGEGLKQSCYVRGESKFSDHRPVYSVFSSQLNLKNKNSALLPTTCLPKGKAEQLFLPARTQSCIQCAPRRFSVAA